MVLERWKPIAGYEGIYEVSDRGRVKSLERQEDIGFALRTRKERILKPLLKRRGYLGYALRKDGVARFCQAHRLVLEAFVGPCPDGYQACHFPDPDVTNNRVENLRWGSPKENARHREIHGTVARGQRSGAYTKPEKVIRGASHYNHRLTEGDIDRITDLRLLTNASQEKIGAWVGYCQAHVSRILAGDHERPRRDK